MHRFAISINIKCLRDMNGHSQLNHTPASNTLTQMACQQDYHYITELLINISTPNQR